MPHYHGYPVHGFGYYGYNPPMVPARIVYNGFGEPVGALPALAALIPSVMSALGPIVSKALPVARSIGSQLQTALPGILQSLPGSPAPGGVTPSMPFAPMAPAPYAPAPMPPAPLVYQQPQMPMRRRRRRRLVRLRRMPIARQVMPTSLPPPVSQPTPVAPPAQPPPSPTPEPPPANETSGGVAGFGYYGFPASGFHSCGRCGGVHGYGGCAF